MNKNKEELLKALKSKICINCKYYSSDNFACCHKAKRENKDHDDTCKNFVRSETVKVTIKVVRESK